MAQDDTVLTKSAPGDEEALPVATLLRAEEVAAPEIKPWHYQELGSIEQAKAQQLRSEVEEKLREEIRPEIMRRASVLKKEAFDTAKKEGYDAGYQAGLEKGQKDAFEQAQQEAKTVLAEKVRALETLLEAMSQPYQQIAQEVFGSLAKLSIQMAEKLIEFEVTTREDWILNAVQEAISQLPDDDLPLDIILNPQDATLIETYQQAHQKKWHIQSDDSIPLGQCKVKQGHSLVVNDWRQRLQDFVQASETVVERMTQENETALKTDAESGEPDENTKPVESTEAVAPRSDSEPSPNATPEASSRPVPEPDATNGAS